MNSFEKLKDDLDAAWEQIKNSALHSELARKEQAAWDNNEPESRLYLRLDDLHAAIFETAALLADDDIKELTATIANEKDETMAKYRMPIEPREGRLWDESGTEYVKVPGSAMSRPWENQTSHAQLYWPELLERCKYLTDTPPAPPVKEGDTGLTAEQVWGLPEGTVIWPERAEHPEPWMRYSDHWESISTVADDAGDLQCAAGDSFRVLVLGGGE